VNKAIKNINGSFCLSSLIALVFCMRTASGVVFISVAISLYLLSCKKHSLRLVLMLAGSLQCAQLFASPFLQRQAHENIQCCLRCFDEAFVITFSFSHNLYNGCAPLYVEMILWYLFICNGCIIPFLNSSQDLRLLLLLLVSLLLSMQSILQKHPLLKISTS
jgi:hypothetical protein